MKYCIVFTTRLVCCHLLHFDFLWKRSCAVFYIGKSVTWKSKFGKCCICLDNFLVTTNLCVDFSVKKHLHCLKIICLFLGTFNSFLSNIILNVFYINTLSVGIQVERQLYVTGTLASLLNWWKLCHADLLPITNVNLYLYAKSTVTWSLVQNDSRDSIYVARTVGSDSDSIDSASGWIVLIVKMRNDGSDHANYHSAKQMAVAGCTDCPETDWNVPETMFVVVAASYANRYSYCLQVIFAMVAGHMVGDVDSYCSSFDDP